MTKSYNLDLLLVNPGGRKRSYQSLGSEVAAIEPPIWAGLLASFARAKGYDVSILDANAENLDAAGVAKEIVSRKPLLTAIVIYGHNPSASTQVMPAAGAICKALRELRPDMASILVGGHVAALQERTLREKAVTFVAGGEGPYTLVELIEALKTGNEDYRRVHGLWYRQDGVICNNHPAPLVTDLDQEMPDVAWDLLPMANYRAHNWHCFGDIPRQPYGALYTTLGCPFHCSFCCIQAPFRDGEKALGYKPGVSSYRLWSPENIIRQIDLLVNKYGITNLKIADELFVCHRRHVLTICDLIISRGYKLNIWAYARVDTLTDEMLNKLKQAGFNWLGLGIESANERVRNDAQKGYRQEHLLKAVNCIKAKQIMIGGNFIFGLPEDDLRTMQETLDLALEILPEFGNFYCAMAYPGSKLYDLALRQGWPLPPTWSGYSQYAVDTLPVPTKYLSGPEVLRFRDHAFITYNTNQKYLDMMAAKFGNATVDDIRKAASHKLDRKYA